MNLNLNCQGGPAPSGELATGETTEESTQVTGEEFGTEEGPTEE